MAWSVRGEINGKEPAAELKVLPASSNDGEMSDTHNEQRDVCEQLVVDAIIRSGMTGPFSVNYGGNRPADWHGTDRGYISISVVQYPPIIPEPAE